MRCTFSFHLANSLLFIDSFSAWNSFVTLIISINTFDVTNYSPPLCPQCTAFDSHSWLISGVLQHPCTLFYCTTTTVLAWVDVMCWGDAIENRDGIPNRHLYISPQPIKGLTLCRAFPVK